MTQNSKVIKELFDKPDVLEHHSNVIPEDKHEYAYLNSNWSSPVIMTTAVQFYQTLFSHNTTSIRRFHQLADSVIIIDEAQTMPLKMISMFNLMMNYLSEICGSTIVLCTATQPSFEKTKRPMSIGEDHVIVDNSLDVIETFKRVHIIDACTKAGFEIDEYASFIMDCWRKHKRVLVIVNTKAEASELYELCKQMKREEDEVLDVYHLSTYMCSEHRDDKLNEIKVDLDLQTNIICISTSLIEAGVDISVDCVIRSLTGLDSIIQAAGRCNRNKTSDFGYVYITKSNTKIHSKLHNVKEGMDAMIPLLNKIKDKHYIDELMLPEVISNYYEHYFYQSKINKDYKITNMSETQINLWSGLHAGRFEAEKDVKNCPVLTSALKTAGENFDVIDATIGVLVPYKKGKDIIAKLNGEAKMSEKYDLLQEAQPYMIQVYENQYRKLMEAGVIEYMDFADVLVLKEGCYNDETGLCLSQEMKDLFV